jgi:hypothetical protein
MKIGLVVLLGGFVLLFIGVGTAIDALYAWSHPVDLLDAFLLKIEYTVAGIVLVLAGYRLR